MSQTNTIFVTLTVGFIVYLIARGQLTSYLDIIGIA